MQIELGAMVGLAAAATGMLFGYLNYRRFCKKDVKDEGVSDGELKADINYIRRGVEDIRVDMKAQEMRFGELSERVTRVEESSKSAHKRIDTMEGKVNA